MKKVNYVMWAAGAVVLFIAVMTMAMAVNYSNKEIKLRNLITAKMQDNQSEYDNMWKKISQTVQVAEKDRQSLMEIFNSYANARASKGNDNRLISRWIMESVPNVGQATFVNLQNTIISSRDAWTMRQKELIDYKREHNNLRMLFPSKFFVGRRSQVKITVITSDKTTEIFEAEKDNETEIFKK